MQAKLFCQGRLFQAPRKIGIVIMEITQHWAFDLAASPTVLHSETDSIKKFCVTPPSRRAHHVSRRLRYVHPLHLDISSRLLQTTKILLFLLHICWLYILWLLLPSPHPPRRLSPPIQKHVPDLPMKPHKKKSPASAPPLAWPNPKPLCPPSTAQSTVDEALQKRRTGSSLTD